jgi:hypothetical protein
MILFLTSSVVALSETAIHLQPRFSQLLDLGTRLAVETVTRRGETRARIRMIIVNAFATSSKFASGSPMPMSTIFVMPRAPSDLRCDFQYLVRYLMECKEPEPPLPVRQNWHACSPPARRWRVCRFRRDQDALNGVFVLKSKRNFRAVLKFRSDDLGAEMVKTDASRPRPAFAMSSCPQRMMRWEHIHLRIWSARYF